MALRELSETTEVSRRAMIKASCALFSCHLAANAAPPKSNQAIQTCTLGFSTYGMKALDTAAAVTLLADIGFDAVEIAVRKDWNADSSTLTRERRASIRSRLADTGLQLSSLMEHVFATSDDASATALERLKMAAEVAHDLAPDRPPVVQTVLGSGKFDEQKHDLRDRLADWVKLANATETTIAIKPHRGGVISRPDDAVWLFKQLGEPPRLRMVYDYSHYAYREMPLSKTVQTALPYTAHIAVKDAVREGTKIAFKLPGESGAIDFAAIMSQFFGGGYRGDFNCEVSSMVSRQPEYDPVQAAKTSYKNMAEAFRDAGVPRPN